MWLTKVILFQSSGLPKLLTTKNLIQILNSINRNRFLIKLVDRKVEILLFSIQKISTCAKNFLSDFNLPTKEIVAAAKSLFIL